MKEKLLKALSYLNISRFLPTKEWEEQANQEIRSIAYAHHVPHRESVPADLKDKEGNFLMTDNGFPVAGRLLPEDIGIGSDSPVLPFIIGFYSVIFILSGMLTVMGLGKVALALNVLYFTVFYIFLGFWGTMLMLAGTVGATTAVSMATSLPVVGQVIGGFSNTILAAVAYSPALAPLVYLFIKKKARAAALVNLDKTFGGATDGMPKTAKNRARFLQAANAEKDNSYFCHYGSATGSFGKTGDEFAPDQGLPVGQTTKDQSTNLAFFGAIGKGKTTNLRQVFKERVQAQEIEKSRTGMMVLDGKSVLAQDCAKYLDILVSPQTIKNFNFIWDLKPEVLARVLENQFAPKKGQTGNSSFFTSGARTMVFYAKVFQEAAVKHGTASKSYMSFFNIGMQLTEPCDKDGKHPIVELFKGHPELDYRTGGFKPGTVLNDAIQFLMELMSEPEETKKNIKATFKSWLLPFVQTEQIRHWAESEESDFDFDSILVGSKIGFVLPESQLGIAGVAITALMKARLFTKIADRGLFGEKWRDTGEVPVCLFVDEAQKIFDDSDLSILPQGRSLGLVAVYATQNFDNYVERFGESGAKAIVESFRSIICLQSSEATYDLISKRIGKHRALVSKGKVSSLAFGSTSNHILTSSIFDTQNSERTWLRRHGSKLLAKMTLRKSFADSLKGNNITEFSTFERTAEPIPVLQAHHLQMLNEPFTAIAVIERAGVVRRDIIKTIPLDANFEPILVSDKPPVGFEDVFKGWNELDNEGQQYEEILFKEAA
ncbi:TraM recognition domain-containing protein [Roseateles sp. PN1]|uniref:TraM recognition domain-containing protein n=1 Tax=Roseateles sp. PN1 TaxID=3137372 RepID=UPI00313A1798